MYELIIVWENKTKSVYQYATEEEAERGADYMQMVFGGQIEWYNIRVK